ncbi:restriction endonuclease subunit S [Microbacterium memoriense]|uniref:Restriction endonuclease subunit S n=1 Tax=Microbacterium memoriense TaxID=2978350 RepID=A0ABT2PAG4_9MICO|nr:restriction endonuclease subunit S [Microbacterium memoriense]MCT9000838.1 restriction endonuclease subunit S [Microbacterium memoriense]
MSSFLEISLPPGWRWAQMGQVARISTGSADVQDSDSDGEYPFYVRSPDVLRLGMHTHDTEAILTAGDGNVGKIFHHARGRFAVHQRVYVIEPTALVTARFLYYAMTALFFDSLRGETAKSTVDSLRRPMLTGFDLPLAPLPGQRQIADYLDHETAEIDAFIADLLQLRDLSIEENESIRSAILLGSESTESFAPLKYFARVTVGIVVEPSRYYTDEGVPTLRGLNVSPERVSTAGVVKISQSGHAANSKSELTTGDVVVVRTGQAGAAAVVPVECNGWNAIDLLIVKPRESLRGDYLAALINSREIQSKIKHGSVGAIQAHFNVESLGNLRIPLVSVSEQAARFSAWSNKSTAVQAAIADIDAAITLAKERRAALITAAVTGQIDVSGFGTRAARATQPPGSVSVQTAIDEFR